MKLKQGNGRVHHLPILPVLSIYLSFCISSFCSAQRGIVAPGAPIRYCPPKGYQDRWSICTQIIPNPRCYCISIRGRTWSQARDFCTSNNMSLWPGEHLERELYSESLSIIYAAFPMQRIGPFWTSIVTGNESDWHPQAKTIPHVETSLRVSGTTRHTLFWADGNMKLNALCFSHLGL